MKGFSLLLIGFFVLTVSGVIAQESTGLEIKVKASIIQYSPTNRLYAIGSSQNIILYRASTNSKIRVLKGHHGSVSSIEFSADGERLLTASTDKTIILWDVEKGTLIKRFSSQKGRVLSAVFIGQGTDLIASISSDKALVIWNIGDGSQILTAKDHTKPIRALVASADGKYIATGGGDGRLVVRDVGSGSIKYDINAHSNWVRSLAFSPDSQFLASGSDDKTVKVWEIETGEQLYDISGFKEWVNDLDYSNDGKYLIVASGDVMVYNAESETLELTIDKPPAVVTDFTIKPDGTEISTIDGSSSKIRFWNTSSLNVSNVLLLRNVEDLNPPLIYISNPVNIRDENIVVYTDLFKLEGTVQDESGVQTLRVRGIDTKIKENSSFIINLPLAMGPNPINVEATDINGNTSVRRFTLDRRDASGNTYNPANAKNHVLIVGIDNYQYWPVLQNAVRDANEVANTLISDYKFSFGDVTVLQNSQGTRTVIINQLRGYIETLTPNDNLLIYYSGHGFFDKLLNEGYWVPVNAEKGSIGDYISNSTILQILKNVRAQHIFIVADACFSGSLFSDQNRGFTENFEKFKSRWGLASGRLETVSDGAYGEHSPFADAFIEYLKSNQEKNILVSDLVQYVKKTVASEYNQTPIGNPLKNLGDEGGEFVFHRKN